MTMFSDVPEIVVEILKSHFGEGLTRAHVVRSTDGQIVVVLPDNQLEAGKWDPLAQLLHTRLGIYSPGLERVLLGEGDLIDADDVLESPDKVPLGDAENIWLVDRLLTNQDWLRLPIAIRPRVPTAVAFSVKGGVGRSTAFAMFAWHLARKGYNVLVVDLDLEAPGIGTMLLRELPRLGLIDWLAETLGGNAEGSLLANSIAVSPVSDDSEGSVSVLPAYGSDSRQYLSKLGRVYGQTLSDDGRIIGLAERLDMLLEKVMHLSVPPDVVLLDSRAGLHDIGSAVVTRLGAEAFLFARNDHQDWWAYRQLFDHLRKSRSVSQGMGNDDDLRWKLKMVAAQTVPNEEARRRWVSASYDVWNDFYDDETAAGENRFDPVVFGRDSPEAPHFPLFVNFDLSVRGLLLTDEASRPNWDFVYGVFGQFFDGAEARLWPEKSSHLEEVGS